MSAFMVHLKTEITGTNKKPTREIGFLLVLPLERGSLLVGVYNGIGKRFGGPDGV